MNGIEVIAVVTDRRKDVRNMLVIKSAGLGN